MPFGSVLRPDADSILVLGIADALVNFDETSAEVDSSLIDLAVRLPLKNVAPRLGQGIPFASTETPIVGSFLNGGLEEMVKGTNFWIESRQKFPVSESPSSVDGAPPRLLRTGNSDAIRRARRGDCAKLDLERVGFGSWGHFEEAVDRRRGEEEGGGGRRSTDQSTAPGFLSL